METSFCGMTGFGFLWLARCSNVRTYQDTPWWWLFACCGQQHVVAEGNGGRWRVMKLPVICLRMDWSVNSALEEGKQKTLQANATSFCTRIKSRREEGMGGRAGFRARHMTKPTEGLSFVSPFVSHYYHNPPSSLVGAEGNRRAVKGKCRGCRVA